MRRTFTGTLTHADSKRNIEHAFEVPDGATRIRISLEHTPHRASGAEHANQVSLSLFDPDGFRGARHNNADQTIRLSSGQATPGYLPGEIVTGTWAVFLDTHRILPPEPLEYRITVDVDSEPVHQSPHYYAPGTTAPRGPGWYRGDLHGHTLHSDGAWDVPDFLQFARDHGLDFVTLTDHNTVSGLTQFASLGDDNLLTIGGMELTTYHGHALALGTREWHEWRSLEGRSMEDLARAILDKGLLFVIAHPRSPGDPACTGCRWEFDEMMPGIAPAVEIWNGIWRQYNEEGLRLYYTWLNEGHRLVATSGTDIHRPPPEDVTGAAANVVYAEELSESALLAAIRQGRLYLSAGPDLRLTAIGDSGAETIMGGTIVATRTIHVRASWHNTTNGDRLRLIVNGVLHEEIDVPHADERSWDLAGETTCWFLLEVRDSQGTMRAITNPIFVA